MHALNKTVHIFKRNLKHTEKLYSNIYGCDFIHILLYLKMQKL